MIEKTPEQRMKEADEKWAHRKAQEELHRTFGDRLAAEFGIKTRPITKPSDWLEPNIVGITRPHKPIPIKDRNGREIGQIY